MKLKYFLASFCCIFLASCGGGSSDNNESSTRQINSLSDIVGLWESFDVIDANRVDEGYVLIESSGVLTYYDYFGDSFDRGRNCYRPDSPIAITHIRDNEFTVGNVTSIFSFNSNGDIEVTPIDPTVEEETLSPTSISLAEITTNPC